MFLFSQLRFSSSIIKQTLVINNVTAFHKHLSRSNIRQCSGITRIGSKVFKESRFLELDKIPKGYQIIYRAPMRFYVKIAHQLTTFSALLVSGLAVYVAIYGSGDLEAPFHLDTSGLAADLEDIKYFAAGFILLSMGMRYIVMRYPHRIYKNEKKYIAVLESQLPFKMRQIQFEKGQVMPMRPYGIMPWRDSWYSVGNQRLMLLTEYFKTPSELYNMMAPDRDD